MYLTKHLIENERTHMYLFHKKVPMRRKYITEQCKYSQLALIFMEFTNSIISMLNKNQKITILYCYVYPQITTKVTFS